MRTIDEIVADLNEVALSIMREPHDDQTPDQRADRLEIACRCHIACAVLKEMPWFKCEQVIKLNECAEFRCR